MPEIKVYHDQHIHSRFSEDSKEMIWKYIKLAKKAGVSYFVTCEHVDFDPVSYDKSWICDFNKLHKRLKRVRGIKTLKGIELGFRDDHINEMNDILSKFSFDIVQLSCHDNGKLDYYLDSSFENYPLDLDDYFDYVIKAVTTFDNFDCLSHFDYGLKSALRTNPNINIRIHEKKLKELFSALIKKNKALEINVKVQSGINDDEYLRYILNLYKSLGGEKLTLSSDAHQKEFYRYNFDKYMHIIKDAGFSYLMYFVERKGYKYYL